MLTRRDLLWLAGASAAAATNAVLRADSQASPLAPKALGLLALTAPGEPAHAQPKAPAQPSSPTLRRMGMTPAGFPFRTRVAGFDMVDHTHSLGVGSVETRLSEPTADAVRALRQRLDTYGMRAVLDVRLPKTESDVPLFETLVKAGKDAGAVCLHAAMTGRRYEDFDTLAAFQASFAKNRQSVTLAEPVLRKHRVKLAIENHKGWRAEEQAAWVRSVGSEYVGVCFDFGNNLSLCEDPLDSLRLLAPLTLYCHLKDMAVEPYDDGFLLSEVPLGEGILDIPGMVKTLQAKDPEMIFGLEMITREPLKIPVFTDKYWATFADASSPLPGRDLARTLRTVKRHPPARPLPRTAGLTPAAQLALEDDCIARSLAFARASLSL
jgi:sugar phosphate isomerase/epimerase